MVAHLPVHVSLYQLILAFLIKSTPLQFGRIDHDSSFFLNGSFLTIPSSIKTSRDKNKKPANICVCIGDFLYLLNLQDLFYRSKPQFLREWLVVC